MRCDVCVCVCACVCVRVCACDVYIMEYYSAIKKEIMPFEAPWMDLEIIKLGERSDREHQVLHDIMYM